MTSISVKVGGKIICLKDTDNSGSKWGLKKILFEECLMDDIEKFK